MKTFAGWYTNAACSDGKEFTLQNCTESTIVYAKWKDPTAVLLDSGYNTGLSKKFADIAETPETITAFQRSAIMPDANVTNEAHCISTENSEVPVYLWKDGTTLKWWSKAVKPEAQSLTYLYNGYSDLTDISGLSGYDTSKVTDMGGMFSGCESLTGLTALSGWNTSRVTSMDHMFAFCRNLTNSSAINDWDILKVTNFTYMFVSCSSHPEFTKRSGTWNDGTFTPTS